MLFFKKRAEKNSVCDNIYLIVGLGNIGKKYDGTRHNVGFMAIDYFAEQYNTPFKASRTQKGDEASVNQGFDGKKIVLLRPNTYMNRSGDAVSAVMKYYKIPKEKILVISDEIHLPVGKLRFRAKGSDGGHNGLWNISNRINSTEFARLRIGVGEKPDAMEQADYVLSRFLSSEKTEIDFAIKNAFDGIKTWINEGVEAAANSCNGL